MGKTLSVANIQTSLTKEQKEAVGLLSIGTFLEFFDLMLYVHMAVLLNELFFPKTDAHSAQLLSAFAFCTTFVFRPIGAVIFGYIGDNLGRKFVVVISTFMMAVSCIAIANAPTYAEIGIAASWIITICRIIQSTASMGEIIGGELYLTETIKPPKQYSIVSILAFSASLGSTVALCVSTLTTSFSFNWRMGFWIGALLSVIGFVARTTLKETKEFADTKYKIKNISSSTNIIDIEYSNIANQKINKFAIVSYFFMHCGWPVCFYLAYMHCGFILKNSFGYTTEQVIYNNLLVSIPQLFVGLFFRVLLSRIVHPFKILKVILFIFSILMVLFPYILDRAESPKVILLYQILIMCFSLDVMPSVSILYSYFPIFKRFSCTNITYAFSRAIIYIVTSFGFVYLTDLFGNYGILIVVIPVTVFYGFSLFYFDKLETLKRQGIFTI